jgi:hypothetical protein
LPVAFMSRIRRNASRLLLLCCSCPPTRPLQPQCYRAIDSPRADRAALG